MCCYLLIKSTNMISIYSIIFRINLLSFYWFKTSPLFRCNLFLFGCGNLRFICDWMIKEILMWFLLNHLSVFLTISMIGSLVISAILRSQISQVCLTYLMPLITFYNPQFLGGEWCRMGQGECRFWGWCQEKSLVESFNLKSSLKEFQGKKVP